MSASSINSSIPQTNWAGNLTYGTGNINYPQAVEDVQRLIKNNKRVKGLGTKHCFNTIADSDHCLIDMTGLNKVLSIGHDAQTVTVEAGIKYGELAPYLHQNGFALHNLASLPHISIGGSCATATHGSGVKNGNLATAVTGLEMIIADGSIIQLDQDNEPEKLNAAIVGLGALGIVTKLTLRIEPTYTIQQNVYTNLPIPTLIQNFESIVSSGYSVSLFTAWQNDTIDTVWIKRRVTAQQDMPGEFYGAPAAKTNLHPLPGIGAEHCTDQLGVPGPWFERLPHFKMGFTPSSGDELQTEYFIQSRHAPEAIAAIAKLGAIISPYLFISEIRTIAADELWMSPCYKRESVAFHFTWKPNWPEVQKLLPLIEKELASYQALPHWGKLFTMAPKVLQAGYKKLPEFKKLITEYDPEGKFSNEFLKYNLFGE